MEISLLFFFVTERKHAGVLVGLQRILKRFGQIKTRKNAIVEYRPSDTRYLAKGTKGKWRYASSKARLKCVTYPRSQYMVSGR